MPLFRTLFFVKKSSRFAIARAITF